MLNLIIPVVAAFFAGIATTLEKFVLRVRKIDFRFYQVLSFLAISLVMLPFILFFFKMDFQALEIKNIIIFLLVVIFSILANFFVFYSMKWEKITNLEPAKLLEPLLTIILAIIFSFIFGQALYERSTRVVIPALIAGSALIFSHLKKHHLEFNRYFLAMILGSFFFALELVITRLILDYYSPLSFYFLRSSMIFLFSLIIFRPKFKKLGKKITFEIFLAGAIWVGYRVLLYYGYLNLGVIYTTLLVLLGPVFIYLFAWKFLKEKLEFRNVIAAIIIIACILYVIIS